MSKCEWCGNDFDPREAEEQFCSEYENLSYSQIRKCLCGDCAIQVIEDEVDGVYFENCEKCGCTFDLIEDQDRFTDMTDGGDLQDYWSNGIICCDCALDRVAQENSECELEDDEEEGDESYCGVCEHADEYPDCQSWCPYDDD